MTKDTCETCRFWRFSDSWPLWVGWCTKRNGYSEDKATCGEHQKEQNNE